VLDYLVDLTTFHVTDLNALECIITPSPLIVPDYLVTALGGIQKLSITLRLPLQAFQETDVSPVQATAATSNPSWLTLCPAITKLERLRRLELWVDHDDPSTWSVVNERAFLSTLDTLVPLGLDISVNLPKLHPVYETPDRHFTHRSARPPYTIARRLRQCVHAVQDDNGEFHDEVKHGFPILWLDDSDEELEEVEQKEREMWENGVDVEAVVRTIPEQPGFAVRVAAITSHLHPMLGSRHEANSML